MPDYAIFLAAQCMMLGACIILREPKLLIPTVVLGLPVEVAETELIHSLGDSGLAGAARSLLNPGQSAMVVTVIVCIFRSRRDIRTLIPDSALVLPLGLLLAVYFLGVLWSDSLIPQNSVLVLPLYFAFVITAPSLIEDRRDVERIMGAFLIAAIGLAVLAIAQRLLGVFNWRGILIQSDAYSYRSNATYADPNNLARFLAISLALAGGLILTMGPKRQTVYLAIPALAVGMVGIVATASRSGWLTLVFCAFLVVIMSPIARYTKARLTVSAISALTLVIVLLLAQGGTDAARVKSLTDAVTVLGQRTFLIEAGWQMFIHNPIAGVGSGNYSNSIQAIYFYLVPYWARATTLSHTAFVSLMAELGLIGLFMFLFLVTRVTLTLVRLYRSTTSHFNRFTIGWVSASLSAILLASQSEGRLFEEPFLWVLFAIVIAFETRPRLAAGVADSDIASAMRESATARRPAPHATRVAAATAVVPEGARS